MIEDPLWPHLRELPYFRAILRAVEAQIMQQVQLPPPVLDLGSGDGHFASVTFDQLIDVGIDPALQLTQEALRRETYRSLIVADGARIPYPDESFGSAFSNSVLEHVDDLEGVLREVARVLRPGASFAITVPNTGYRKELSVPTVLSKVRLAGLGEKYQKWFMRMSRTLNLFDEEGWNRKLQEAGFKVNQSFRYFSSRALHALEWGHYFGAPCLVAHWLTKRWILSPTRANLLLTYALVQRYVEPFPVNEGTYTFYLAHRR
jgi:ubiquinone/menaquinone biosynthesis C-methylase UbiE